MGMIFGIGMSKTGTHTLNACLEILGFRSIHYPDPTLMKAGKFDEALAGYDAATDISVSAYFRELDIAYPGSKFILTLRDIESWLRSVEDHRTRREHELSNPDCPKAAVREVIYGTRQFDRVTFVNAYWTHVEQVRDHFYRRSKDLLELDLCSGEGWERLCPFLGVPIPERAIPRLNQTRFAA